MFLWSRIMINCQPLNKIIYYAIYYYSIYFTIWSENIQKLSKVKNIIFYHQLNYFWKKLFYWNANIVTKITHYNIAIMVSNIKSPKYLSIHLMIFWHSMGVNDVCGYGHYSSASSSDCFQNQPGFSTRGWPGDQQKCHVPIYRRMMTKTGAAVDVTPSDLTRPSLPYTCAPVIRWRPMGSPDNGRDNGGRRH